MVELNNCYSGTNEPVMDALIRNLNDFRVSTEVATLAKPIVSNAFCIIGNAPGIVDLIFLFKLDIMRRFPPAPGISPTPTSTSPI